MARWKIFDKSKGKEQTDVKNEKIVKQTEQSNDKTPMFTTKPAATPSKEYSETLYSIDSTKNKSSLPCQETKQPLKRTSWESPRTIEQRIDRMGHIQQENEINKKVDRTLQKKKLDS